MSWLQETIHICDDIVVVREPLGLCGEGITRITETTASDTSFLAGCISQALITLNEYLFENPDRERLVEVAREQL